MTSLYDVSIPVLAKIMRTMSAILKKGETWAKENNISTTDLMDSRLYEDMLSLSDNVVISASTCKKAIQRLSGPELPGPEFKEKTIEELHAIIDETLKQLGEVKKSDVDSKKAEIVPCSFGRLEMKATAINYAQGYVIPTAFFHLNMIYAILRSKGVPLGKKDAMNEFLVDFEGWH
ncbi:uncharacterized protein BCR38DRAFT_481700 [Pseudomassariella vexata]|uniref:Helix-turn-helix-domain containing protein type n=1 Tax=Pseudomassariella vexata TaxID=1141098 RepID=A0A1Y2EA80_9PEZI|nr:uncharacterized protein BCR38DRAFT_481700 [Pseudomassariella vexata]ORY68214.1 hypothetical protein BCR38DRAFT_481700 [Pseudomassariella vexata]